MEDFLNLSIQLHLVSIFATMLMALVQLFITKIPTPSKAIKYLWNLLPLYYCVLTCVIFTGLILLKFIQNWILLFCMVLAWLFVLMSTIKTYKWMKAVREDNSLESLILRFIRKKYLIDIVLFVFLIFISS